ncbi:hypothetical protein IWX49DRAFT_91362 [Phyllosticta citricarpa]|uniref:Transmembrane protein n=2 Tax=Phyllosticta TaxID=121621 RepID=A0ABR1LV17_9PEZI
MSSECSSPASSRCPSPCFSDYSSTSTEATNLEDIGEENPHWPPITQGTALSDLSSAIEELALDLDDELDVFETSGTGYIVVMILAVLALFLMIGRCVGEGVRLGWEACVAIDAFLVAGFNLLLDNYARKRRRERRNRRIAFFATL